MHLATGHGLFGITIFAALFAFAAESRGTIIVTNNFDTDPGWTGIGNTSGGANYGFSNTSNAGGSPGEIGGTFARQAGENYYAHVFMSGAPGDRLDYDSDIIGSGQFVVPSFSTLGNSQFIGHLSSDTANRSFIGLELADLSATHARAFATFRWGAASFSFSTSMSVPLGSTNTFNYVYDPLGGVDGLGRLTLSLSGAVNDSRFLDVTASQRTDGIFLNAFGLGTPPVPPANPANTAVVWLDNAVYTIPEPGAVVLLAIAGVALTKRKR